MSDREWLKLAAQAAGHKLYPEWDCAPNGILLGQGVDGDPQYVWNPIDCDGDALRLAVELDLLFTLEFSRLHSDELASGKDPAQATRRAIVRAAAAEIRHYPCGV
jgi:hypothetical protein